MKRGTKMGIVVLSSFLVLVAVVLVSKLRKSQAASPPPQARNVTKADVIPTWKNPKVTKVSLASPREETRPGVELGPPPKSKAPASKPKGDVDKILARAKTPEVDRIGEGETDRIEDPLDPVPPPQPVNPEDAPEALPIDLTPTPKEAGPSTEDNAQPPPPAPVPVEAPTSPEPDNAPPPVISPPPSEGAETPPAPVETIPAPAPRVEERPVPAPASAPPPEIESPVPPPGTGNGPAPPPPPGGAERAAPGGAEVSPTEPTPPPVRFPDPSEARRGAPTIEPPSRPIPPESPEPPETSPRAPEPGTLRLSPDERGSNPTPPVPSERETVPPLRVSPSRGAPPEPLERAPQPKRFENPANEVRDLPTREPSVSEPPRERFVPRAPEDNTGSGAIATSNPRRSPPARVIPAGAQEPSRIVRPDELPIRREPEVISYDETEHRCGRADDYRALSLRYYNNRPDYGEALRLYNRNDALTDDPNAALGKELREGMLVLIPPQHVLESRYYREIYGDRKLPPLDREVRKPVTSGDSEPSQVPGNRGQARTVDYVVRPGGETMREIARKQLGNGEREIEIIRLNPGFSPVYEIPAGTRLVLPAN